MRHYDGSRKFEAIERELSRSGYAQKFCLMSYDVIPKDLGYTGKEGGWELRRKITAWCRMHGIMDFRIVRNTSYHRDLHGVVYELWARSPEKIG
jgi:hypothetical protein